MPASYRAITTLVLGFLLLLPFATLASSSGAVENNLWQNRVDPWVLDTAAKGDTEFLVFLTEQADLSQAYRFKTKAEKGRYVYQQLTSIARRTQKPLLNELKHNGVEHRAYWVVNMIWVRGSQELIEKLARRSDVARIHANPSVQISTMPIQTTTREGSRSPEAIEWNLTKVNAPDVWAAGFTGQGAVIAGQDTGYSWTHEALINQYRGWDGVNADHDYNWHDAIHDNDPNTPAGNPCGFNSPVPCDDQSHGTHTMGSMVGDNSAGKQIGMAPGARWVGCRNMEQGWGTPATYAECYQWFIAPTRIDGSQPRPDLAPDVINNSWGCPTSEGCTDPLILQSVVNNVRAAGILTVHSAGNSGSSCYTINTPAAIYDASFTVGATDSSDTIAGFSGRGSVTVDGSNRPKPDISAPGVNIYSSIPGNNYGVSQGTSMAAPHVSGLVALLVSANPGLRGEVDTLENIITTSALPRTITTQDCGVPGTNVPNNTYGWGRIDALAALQRIHRIFLPFFFAQGP